MFPWASCFLTLALGSALVAFGGILPTHAIVSKLLFVVSTFMFLLMIMGAGLRHSRSVKAFSAPVQPEKATALISSIHRDMG